MKSRFAAAAICILAGHLLAQPNKSPSKNEKKPTDDAGETITLTYNQESAQKAEAPKPSPPHWYASSEWWLVIVAAATAGFICWQARQTAIATKAVKGNTSAFIASQKAIMVAEPNGDPFAMLRIGTVPRVVLDLYNRGRTTSFQCLYETWIELVPNSVTDDGFSFDDINFEFSAAAYHHVSKSPLSVYPDHGPVQVSIPIPGGLTPEQRLDIEKARLLVCFRILVKFSDSFTPKRYADFGFWVRNDGLGFLAKYSGSD